MNPHRTEQTLSFACTDCGRRAPKEGDCVCGAGALVDLANPDMRALAIETDDRRTEEHGQRLLWISVGLSVSFGAFLLLVIPGVIKAIPLPVPFANPIKVFAIVIGFAVLSSKLLGAAFPARRRFPELVVGRGGVALPARLLAPRKTTLAVVVGLVVLGIGLAVAVPLGQKYVAEEEIEHRQQLVEGMKKLQTCVTEADAKAAAERDPSPWGDPEPVRNADRTGCQRELDALYDAVDGRRADMPLRLALEGKLACDSKCNAGLLADAYRDVENAAIDMYLVGASVVARPEPTYGRGSPWAPRRSRQDSPLFRVGMPAQENGLLDE
jgi:hypothetical protein